MGKTVVLQNTAWSAKSGEIMGSNLDEENILFIFLNVFLCTRMLVNAYFVQVKITGYRRGHNASGFVPIFAHDLFLFLTINTTCITEKG